MTTKFIGVKEFRQNMASVTALAQKNNERLIILRKNKPIFELKPLSEKEATLEQLILDVNEGLDDVKNGRVYTHEEIKSFFGIS